MITSHWIASMFLLFRGREIEVTCDLNIDLIDRENVLIFLSKTITFSDDSMNNFLIVKFSERIPCLLLWT